MSNVTEILPRVSFVKSLLRFKCLSKSWYNFISTENFTKNHLKNSVTNSTPDAICISTFVNKYVVNHCPVDDLFSEQGTNDNDLVQFEIEIHDHRMTSFMSTQLIGCSNGLCCILLSGKDFVLLNSNTRQYYKLPPPSNESVLPAIKGFGYDETNNDYKVLVRSIKHNYYRLYSLKTNSWKTVDNFIVSNSDWLAHRDICSVGVFVNGKLHWPMWMYDKNIVSFDLGSEAIGVVEEPNEKNSYRYYMLGVIEGYLCVFLSYYGESTDVWAMKEYGVKQSWCKMVTLPDLSYDLITIFEPHYPLYISEEGDVLVAHQSFKFAYNLKTKSRRRLEIKNSWWFHIGTCIQSLVSPFPPVNERMEEAELTG